MMKTHSLWTVSHSGTTRWSRTLTLWSRLFGALIFSAVVAAFPSTAAAAPLLAGVAKVDITNVDAGPVNDRLYARALVLKSDTTTAAIITVDAVAIGEIGHIKNDYLPKVRSRIEKSLGIKPANILVDGRGWTALCGSDGKGVRCKRDLPLQFSDEAVPAHHRAISARHTAHGFVE